MSSSNVPFFRPDLSGGETEEVVATLASGWLTTGPRVKRFEEEFAAAVGARHAIALNSCTAALHLAVEALGLRPGQAVLVPTMTFAATAEVVRYLGAVPVLVDCDPVTLNVDLDDAERRLEDVRAGRVAGVAKAAGAVGIMPVHVGGLMLDAARIRAWAVAQEHHPLGDGGDPWVVGHDHDRLLASMANRHGLIAGATGTGKTVTLRVMAEGLSRLGVPATGR